MRGGIEKKGVTLDDFELPENLSQMIMYGESIQVDSTPLHQGRTRLPGKHAQSPFTPLYSTEGSTSFGPIFFYLLHPFTSLIGEDIDPELINSFTTWLYHRTDKSSRRTIGQMLGRAVNGRFLDADDYHSESNKEKMRNGIHLTDEDRVPWLETLRDVLRRGLADNEAPILACSALQKQYREILRSADSNYEPGSYASVIKFVLLEVGAEVLAARLEKRAAEGKHFMPAKLLQTQLDLLQIDEAEGVFKVVATLDPDNIVKTVQTFVI